MQMGHGFGFTGFHVAVFITGRGDIFVDPFIAPDKLGETFVF